MGDLARCVLAAGTMVFVVAPAEAVDDGELRPQERAYVQATALFVMKPSKMTGKWEMKAFVEKNEDDWKKSNDPVLKALASIEENPEFREKYRRSLEKLLGDRPSRNSKKILADIKSNYAAEKLGRYREVIASSKGRKLRPGALPWPICIPFDCCE